MSIESDSRREERFRQLRESIKANPPDASYFREFAHWERSDSIANNESFSPMALRAGVERGLARKLSHPVIGDDVAIDDGNQEILDHFDPGTLE